MVRLHEDVDGCGCLRCQGVDHEVLRRSLADAFVWSVTLPFVRPSILLVLGAIGLLQLAVLVVPAAVAIVLIVFSVLGVFLGRGYVGVVSQGTVGRDAPSPGTAVWLVLCRSPSFLGAVVALILWLFAVSVLTVTVLAPSVRWVAGRAGIEPVFAEFGTVFLLAGVVVYTLLKCCFVPEACFVGGYGPLTSIRVSWLITSVHRAKVGVILAGFVTLLGVGAVLDTQFAGSGAPVALSFEVGETTVVLRSFGLSLSGSVRFAFDLAVTAVYSGVFVHQYVDNVFKVSVR